MTEPRLSNSEKIAQSESLSALFSYFKEWAPQDPTLKFSGDSVVKEQLAVEKDKAA